MANEPDKEHYYTADTVRRLIAEAEQRMKDRCVAVCETLHKEFGNGNDYAAAIKELK